MLFKVLMCFLLVRISATVLNGKVIKEILVCFYLNRNDLILIIKYNFFDILDEFIYQSYRYFLPVLLNVVLLYFIVSYGTISRNACGTPDPHLTVHREPCYGKGQSYELTHSTHVLYH